MSWNIIMRMTLKLYATLSDHLPPEADGQRRKSNELPLNVANGATVQGVIDRFNVPSKPVHLVLVNDVYIPLEPAPGMPSRRTTSLRSDRRLRAADGMRRMEAQ